MKKVMLVALTAMVAVRVARGQDAGAIAMQANSNVAADFANTSAAALPLPLKVPGALSMPSKLRLANSSGLADPSSFAEPAEAGPAVPDPKPEPRFVYGGRDDFRWQLALGISLVRFRSSFYYATGVGTNTSVTYFTNEWLGVEGNVNTAFAPAIYLNEHVKYASYGAGPKIAWRARQWEPWLHAIVGGAHILPQTAGHSQNGFGMQVGGGMDYRIYPHLSARLEVDWIKTHFFGEWQNSAQANADVVLHF